MLKHLLLSLKHTVQDFKKEASDNPTTMTAFKWSFIIGVINWFLSAQIPSSLIIAVICFVVFISSSIIIVINFIKLLWRNLLI